MTEATPRNHRRPAATDQVNDIVESVKAYARQETIDPLKGAGRWVAVGSIGALCLGLAMVFLALAVLRMSQDLGGSALDGAWSFSHYLITFVVVAALVAASFSRIKQRSLAKGE